MNTQISPAETTEGLERKMEYTTKMIRAFNEERNLMNSSMKNELSMFKEEAKEYIDAIEENEPLFDIMKELADVIIVAKGTMLKCGFHPDKLVEEKMKLNLSREGHIDENGKWRKNKDQDKSTLYVPNYAKCLLK